MATFIPIESLVYDYLLSKGMTVHYFVPVLRHALEVAADIGMYQLPRVRSVELEVDETGRVNLPADFVDYSRVGLKNGSYVFPIPHDGSQVKHVHFDASGAPGTHGLPSATGVSAFAWWDGPLLNYDGTWGGGIPNAADGTFKYTFRPDYERQQLIITPYLPKGSTVVVEYVSFDEDDGDVVVPRFAQRVIHAWIEWQMLKEDNMRRTASALQLAERQYINEKRRFEEAVGSLSIADIENFIRKYNSGTVRL